MIEWTAFDESAVDAFYFSLNRPTDFLIVDAGPSDDSQFQLIFWSIGGLSPPAFSSGYEAFTPGDVAFLSGRETFTALYDFPLSSLPANDGQEFLSQTPDEAWLNPSMTKGEWLFQPGNYQAIVNINEGGDGSGYAALAPVPEPSTWALLIAGFALMRFYRAVRSAHRMATRRRELSPP